MDIARHIPELVQSHELRSEIYKVKQLGHAEVFFFNGEIIQIWFSSLDADAQQRISSEWKRVTAGTPGP